MQFIYTSELSPDSNMWLRGLTDDLAQGELVEKLLGEYRRHQKNSLYKSVMNMIIRANWKVFEEEKKVCEALRELFGEELTNAVAVGVAAGIKEQLPIAVEERVAEIVEERVAEIVEERVAEAVEERVSEVRREGMYALIADNLEEGFSVDKILGKREKKFGLTASEAQGYFSQFIAG